jgi:hypothetical protein
LAEIKKSAPNESGSRRWRASHGAEEHVLNSINLVQLRANLGKSESRDQPE